MNKHFRWLEAAKNFSVLSKCLIQTFLMSYLSKHPFGKGEKLFDTCRKLKLHAKCIELYFVLFRSLRLYSFI